MKIDTRTFSYALEPLLTRTRWQLDTARSLLSSALERGRALRGELDKLRARQRSSASSGAPLPQGIIDPDFAHRHLAHLGLLLRQATELEERLAAQQRECDACMKRCSELQRRLELLEEHRRRCLREHRVLLQRREATAADRDWTLRAHARRMAFSGVAS
jgi:hypothetical protein